MDDSLNETLSILGVYLNENIFYKEFRSNILKGKNYELKKVKKYHQLLSSVNWFVKKVSRYEIYFREFYSDSENIKNFEELEHHVHAYLEDIATVKNKLAEYLGALKNDITKVAINKDEIKALFIFLDQQMHKAFQSPLSLRRTHRHNGYRFVDTNLIDAELAETMLSNNLIKDQLTQVAIDKFLKQRVESFEKAKTFWTENARKNNIQVSGIVNDINSRTKDFLFLLLDINPQKINELILQNKTNLTTQNVEPKLTSTHD